MWHKQKVKKNRLFGVLFYPCLKPRKKKNKVVRIPPPGGAKWWEGPLWWNSQVRILIMKTLFETSIYSLLFSQTSFWVDGLEIIRKTKTMQIKCCTSWWWLLQKWPCSVHQNLTSFCRLLERPNLWCKSLRHWPGKTTEWRGREYLKSSWKKKGVERWHFETTKIAKTA